MIRKLEFVRESKGYILECPFCKTVHYPIYAMQFKGKSQGFYCTCGSHIHEFGVVKYEY